MQNSNLTACVRFRLSLLLTLSSPLLTGCGDDWEKPPIVTEEVQIAIQRIEDHGGCAIVTLRRGNYAVRFAGAPLTDLEFAEVFPSIQVIPQLQDLDVGFTQISDASVDLLIQLEGLQTLTVTRTNMTAAGIDRLWVEMPPPCDVLDGTGRHLDRRRPTSH